MRVSFVPRSRSSRRAPCITLPFGSCTVTATLPCEPLCPCAVKVNTAAHIIRQAIRPAILYLIRRCIGSSKFRQAIPGIVMQISERIQETLSHPLSFTGFLDSGINLAFEQSPTRKVLNYVFIFVFLARFNFVPVYNAQWSNV